MTTPALYQSRPIKRRRRTWAEISLLRYRMYEVLEQDHPMTVRQLFYQMVSRGIIEKTEGAYKNIVVRLLGDMRRDGDVPFGWITDSTRWMRKPRSFSSLEDALNRTAQTYRRALWDSQPDYVEVWLEKEALAGVLCVVTAKWDVPLMVTRGYPSLTYLYEAAETIQEYGKPTYLYYFGDYDPSGLDITRTVEHGIQEFAPEINFTLERVAVTREQIEELSLPTRPTKQTDSRSKNFEGESVEVDAIPPHQLRELAQQCIAGHIDEAQLKTLEIAEESEREILMKIAKGDR